MSPKQIVVSGKVLLAFLVREGFVIHRIKGSHHMLKHADGRQTTIPVHKNDDLPSGLLRKIVKEDIKMSFEEFEQKIKK